MVFWVPLGDPLWDLCWRQNTRNSKPFRVFGIPLGIPFGAQNRPKGVAQVWLKRSQGALGALFGALVCFWPLRGHSRARFVDFGLILEPPGPIWERFSENLTPLLDRLGVDSGSICGPEIFENVP